ncbi:hypothetical protein [Caulobacter hibisci]|uniref:Uncharacterized protein n=1 Tax=Caulobacter hibisci TaxID=2035993 RepID=A0ABS0SZR4_9CAUL|nr:hypothetical protein [Caulobacter hibisci]MBI1684944.1 hypothetical protein [Caulobacter hibisci]
MGFYGPEPFDTAEATYVWTGLRTPGFFSVKVQGAAPNFTSGIQLVREPDFVGGLAVKVMGWTGPVAKGTTPYAVSGTFNGFYVPKILIVGANKSLLIDVKEIPFTTDEAYVAQLTAAAKEPEPAY